MNLISEYDEGFPQQKSQVSTCLNMIKYFIETDVLFYPYVLNHEEIHGEFTKNSNGSVKSSVSKLLDEFKKSLSVEESPECVLSEGMHYISKVNMASKPTACLIIPKDENAGVLCISGFKEASQTFIITPKKGNVYTSDDSFYHISDYLKDNNLEDIMVKIYVFTPKKRESSVVTKRKPAAAPKKRQASRSRTRNSVTKKSKKE